MVKTKITSISEKIFNASKNGNKEELIELLKTKNIKKYFNYKDKITKNSALHIAIINGYNECVKLLILSGFNVNVLNNDHLTPLHISIKVNNQECLRLLLINGANINKITKTTGSTPLHFACKLGNMKIISLLLDYGADTNILNSNHLLPIRTFEHLKNINIDLYYKIHSIFILNGISHVLNDNHSITDKENILKTTLLIINILRTKRFSINIFNDIIKIKINAVTDDKLHISLTNYRQNIINILNYKSQNLKCYLLTNISNIYIYSSVLKNILSRVISISSEDMIYAIQATKINNITTRSNVNEIKKKQLNAIYKIALVGRLQSILKETEYINTQYDILLKNRIELLNNIYSSIEVILRKK